MNEIDLLYKKQDERVGTHLALSWKGRVRYTVPRETVGQQACWKVFRPGRLGIPMRAMALLPRYLGAARCVENENLEAIRDSIGKSAGLSCCRAGSEGVWSKDTLLFLDKKTTEPLFVVKAGTGEAVNALLQNEANWLQTLRGQASLAEFIPESLAHRFGADLCFVAQSALSGDLNFRLGDKHFEFLKRLQKYSLQLMPFEDSRLIRTLRSRIKDLSGLLPEAWSSRLGKGMRRLEQSLSGAPILLVAAHNDFTPWNIRVGGGAIRVFDWEYADNEQLPLFDALHFVLGPMALKGKPPSAIVRKMRETVQNCQKWLGNERCYKAETQALAYMMNLCTLYIWAERSKCNSHPTLLSYARVIDFLCCA